MRYAQGGGFTLQEQRRREEVRLRAAEMFEQGVTNAAVARTLRVTERSVERWRRAWREGGIQALASAGPHALPRLSPAQFARLEAELERGPLAHGFADQRWTLMRIKTLIGRMFHIGYTVQGVWALRRDGWSCQRPTRRAIVPLLGRHVFRHQWEDVPLLDREVLGQPGAQLLEGVGEFFPINRRRLPAPCAQPHGHVSHQRGDLRVLVSRRATAGASLSPARPRSFGHSRSSSPLWWRCRNSSINWMWSATIAARPTSPGATPMTSSGMRR
ncbi:transposase [Planotetraspora sp. GP83]|uniref:helix-turn-helix domain-containing protein n=1 Tax=Planotetraspora sp. GP83 TaxID=3156264 RepID=UPI0035183A85